MAGLFGSLADVRAALCAKGLRVEVHPEGIVVVHSTGTRSCRWEQIAALEREREAELPAPPKVLGRGLIPTDKGYSFVKPMEQWRKAQCTISVQNEPPIRLNAFLDGLERLEDRIEAEIGARRSHEP
jgi:hypothetical protein